MTAKKSKSINKDEIELFIDDDVFLVIYKNRNYNCFMDTMDSWHPYFLYDDYFTDHVTPINNEVDRLLYSDVIDSFIEYYISEQS